MFQENVFLAIFHVKYVVQIIVNSDSLYCFWDIQYHSITDLYVYSSNSVELREKCEKVVSKNISSMNEAFSWRKTDQELAACIVASSEIFRN